MVNGGGGRRSEIALVHGSGQLYTVDLPDTTPMAPEIGIVAPF